MKNLNLIKKTSIILTHSVIYITALSPVFASASEVTSSIPYNSEQDKITSHNITKKSLEKTSESTLAQTSIASNDSSNKLTARDDPKTTLSNSSVPSAEQIGSWGTVSWSFDSSTATITFTSEGTLGNRLNAPWKMNEEIAKKLKKIRFTTSVKLPPKSRTLFSDLPSLKTVEGVQNLDTSSVTDMESMFSGDISLTQLDLSSFDTSNVTSMNGMFYKNESLTQINLSSFNTSNLKSTVLMFSGDISLTQLDLSSFDTSNVVSMHSMFLGDSQLLKLYLNNFDTTQAPDMEKMFYAVNELTVLSLGQNTILSTNSELPTSSFIHWSNLSKNWEGTTDDLYTRSKQGVADTYVRIAQPVTIKYVDENGNKIHEPQTIKGNVGDPYDVSTDTYKLKIDGFTLDTTKLPAVYKGTLSVTPQTVTYVYNQIAQPVTIKYVDENGNKIHEPQTIKGNVGDPYDVSTDTYKNKLPDTSESSFNSLLMVSLGLIILVFCTLITFFKRKND